MKVEIDLGEKMEYYKKKAKIVSAFFLGVILTSFLLADTAEETSNEYKQQMVEYKESYKELNTSYWDLRARYNDNVNNVEEVRNEFRDIPETPAISSIEYSLYGRSDGTATQIAIEHPDMYVSSPAGTGSMSPGISSQSMVIYTESFDRWSLTPGSIVSYSSPGQESNTLHRIHEVNSKDGGICYVTKGDANYYNDGECIAPDRVEALVIGTIFRETGEITYCNTELEYGPESGYCP